MNIKNSVVSLLVLLVVAGISSTTHASPRNSHSSKTKITQAELQSAQSLLKKPQMEIAYERLLSESKKTKVKAKSSQKIVKKPRKSFRSKKVASKSQSKTTPANFNQRLKVTATAYTSHVNQTDSTPNIAAWGDRLKPGMKAIAVSRDLLKVYGLKHKQKVRIKGLKGEYVVLDKMNKRWRKKIDIYMGMNKGKAIKWGRRKVEILWNS